MLSAIYFLLGVIIGVLACIVGILAMSRKAHIEDNEITFEPLVPVQPQHGEFVKINKTEQLLKEKLTDEVALGDVIEDD
jgi:hypothetical protein